jgi:GNAT superfamily N-acetyltransferase
MELELRLENDCLWDKEMLDFYTSHQDAYKIDVSNIEIGTPRIIPQEDENTDINRIYRIYANDNLRVGEMLLYKVAEDSFRAIEMNLAILDQYAGAGYGRSAMLNYRENYFVEHFHELFPESTHPTLIATVCGDNRCMKRIANFLMREGFRLNGGCFCYSP